MATVLKQNTEPRDARDVELDVPEPTGRRRIVLPIVILLLVLGVAWAFKQWSYARAHESTDDAAVDGHLVPVLAKVGGYVQSVTVSDNDHIRADSLLVQIDPAEYRVRLAQAEADLAAARATAGT
ncbi:MAG TPA: biotin/lipoyl-binding protein, partial [Gemmatimonadaceae bacterium]|nr:biotin/lipoyl-binding protein [Gemmatimonadaceae bacterium]